MLLAVKAKIMQKIMFIITHSPIVMFTWLYFFLYKITHRTIPLSSYSLYPPHYTVYNYPFTQQAKEGRRRNNAELPANSDACISAPQNILENIARNKHQFFLKNFLENIARNKHSAFLKNILENVSRNRHSVFLKISWSILPETSISVPQKYCKK